MKGERRIQRALRRCRLLTIATATSLKDEGIAGTAKRICRFLNPAKVSYKKWMKTPLYTDEQLQEQRIHSFDRNVRFSIITPLYNTSEKFLREMIESVIAQTYSEWELCMADGSDDRHDYVSRICMEYAEKDSRIRCKKLEENLGIAGNSNACIEMATGDYISLLDHDDVLHPSALFDTMEAICSQGADFIYTDEATFCSPDKTDIISIHFKPDFAPDNLKANNYICHFTSFSRALLDECGTFREGYDGAQDHELILRLTDKADCIVHVPKVLYLWRAHPESTAASEENKPYVSMAGVKAVKDYLSGKGINAEVTLAKGIPTIYRVNYPLSETEPKVSIIIANCDHVNDLKNCISSIKSKTRYSNYEIVIVENNSKSAEVFSYYRELESSYSDIKVIRWPGKGFNWAAINNYAVENAAAGEYLLLLNNDTEVISAEWIEEMLMYAQRPDVGAVGAMLYYPDDTVQHAGVFIGIGRVAAHIYSHAKRGAVGYMGKLSYAQNLSAVTGACMMMRRGVWDDVGGLDEKFAENYNDIDLCLRIRKAGYLIVWTPYSELYHYESKSRGHSDNSEKRILLEKEIQLFIAQWADVIERGDPYFNPNFSLRYTNYSLKNREIEK